MEQCSNHDLTMVRIFDKIDEMKERSSVKVNELKDDIHAIDKNIAAYQASTDTKLDFIAKNLKRSTVIPAINDINWIKLGKGLGILITAITAALGGYYATTNGSSVATNDHVQIEERDTASAIETVSNDGL